MAIDLDNIDYSQFKKSKNKTLDLDNIDYSQFKKSPAPAPTPTPAPTPAPAPAATSVMVEEPAPKQRGFLNSVENIPVLGPIVKREKDYFNALSDFVGNVREIPGLVKELPGMVRDVFTLSPQEKQQRMEQNPVYRAVTQDPLNLETNMRPFRNFVDSATFGLPTAANNLVYRATGLPSASPDRPKYRPDSAEAIAFTEKDPQNKLLKGAKDIIVDPLSLTFRNPDRLGEFGGYFVPGVAIESALTRGAKGALETLPKFAQRGITGAAAGLTDATLQEAGDVAFRGQPFDPLNPYLGAALGGGLNIGLGAAGDAIGASARGLRRPQTTVPAKPSNPTAPTVENASRLRQERIEKLEDDYKQFFDKFSSDIDLHEYLIKQRGWTRNDFALLGYTDQQLLDLEVDKFLPPSNKPVTQQQTQTPPETTQQTVPETTPEVQPPQPQTRNTRVNQGLIGQARGNAIRQDMKYGFTGLPVTARRAKRNLDEILNEQTAPETQVPPQQTQVPPQTPVVNQQTPPQQTQTQAPQANTKPPRTLITTNNDQEIKIEYALVEADDLIVSNDPISLRKNPNYDESLQPRDREKTTYELQIQSILNPNKFNPDRLSDSPTTSEGAPIVFNNMVESGNGRTIALKRGYITNNPIMQVYRQYLKDNASRLGLSSDQVDSMRNPVLVRVRQTDLNTQERDSYLRDSNVSSTAALGATEEAMLDSRFIDDSVVNLLDAEGNIDFTSAKNSSFVSSFLRKVVPANELNRFIDSDGMINQAGVNRIRNAIFAKAYENEQAIARLAESTDDNVKNISQALLNFSPRLMKLKSNIANGTIYDADISKDLADALTIFSDMKRNKQTIENYFNQQTMFDDTNDVVKSLLVIFDQLKNKRQRLTTVLNTYADEIEAYGDPNQMTLFGDVDIPSKTELLEAAMKREQTRDGGSETDLFSFRQGETKGDSGNRETSGSVPNAEENAVPNTREPEQQSREPEVNQQRAEDTDEYLFSEQRRIEITNRLKREFQKRLDQYKDIFKKGNIDRESYDKLVKGQGFANSAEIREAIQGDLLIPIEGGLTGKELANKIKQLETNYEGKEVIVNGMEGVIERNVFGKVVVRFKDGNKMSYDAMQVKPKVNIDDLIRSQKEREAAVLGRKNEQTDKLPENETNQRIDEKLNQERRSVLDTADDFFKNQQEEILRRINDRRNRLSSNPLDEYLDYALYMAYGLARGTIKAADFTAVLVREFGEELRPYAQQIFKQAREIALRELKNQQKPPVEQPKEPPKITSEQRQLPKQDQKPKSQPKPKTQSLFGDEFEVKGDGTKERKFVTTLTDSGKLPKTVKDDLSSRSTSRYKPISNQETLDLANKRIQDDADAAERYVLNESEDYTAEKAATGQRLIDRLNKLGNEAKGKGDTAEANKLYTRAADVASAVAQAATKAGQAIQALSIFNRLTPEGLLIHVSRTVDKANRQLPKNQKPFKLTAETVDDIQNIATTMQTMTNVREMAKTVEDVLELVKKGETISNEEAQLLVDFVKQSEQLMKEAKKPPKAETPKAEKPPKPNVPKAQLPKDKKVREAVRTFVNAQADAARERLRARGIQVSSMPLDIYADYAVIGASKIVNGVVDFADWSEEMVKDIGENMRPFLQSIWDRSQEFVQESEKTTKKISQDRAVRLVNKLIKDKELSAEEADRLTEFAIRVAKLAGEEKRLASQDLQALMLQYEKPSLDRKISSAHTIGLLLNPKTIARNAIGNELFYRVERLNKYFSTPIDMLQSKLTGKERTVTFKTNNQGEYWKNWMKGWRAGWRGLNIAGLETQFDLRGPAFKSRKNPLTYLEKTLGATLRSFDYAGYMRAYNETLGELATLRAMNEGQGKNKKLIERYIRESDENIMEIADQYGKYVTFQDNNVISKALVNVKRTLNLGKDFGLGDAILKFPRTPGALLMRSLEYSPAGFLRSAYLLNKAIRGKKDEVVSTRDIVESVSRAVHGTIGLTGMGYFLMMNGVLTGAGSTDRDVRDLQRSAGQGKYQLNISSLIRFVNSGFDPKKAGLKEGDLLYSYDWAQPVAISVSLGANIKKAQEEGLDESKGAFSFVESSYDSLSGAFSTLTEQSVLQGLSKFAEGYPGQPFLDKLVKTAADIPPSFVPTLLNQIRQLSILGGDEYSRETYDPSLTKQMVNRMINRVPYASKTLPQQYDALGKERKPYQKNSVFNVMFNPGFTSRYKLSEEARYVTSLIDETKNEQLAPRVPERKISVDGVSIALTNEEFALLQKYQGEITRELIAKNAKRDQFKRLEKREENVEKSLNKAGELARAKLLKEMVNVKQRVEEAK
jgi:hypothetical protein